MVIEIAHSVQRIAYRLKNKKILITAGPTWVTIDSVRVISNTATGETGSLLAEKLKRLGAKVTLLLGPVEQSCLRKGIKLIRFKSFDELRGIVRRELKLKQYDIVIHSAAVSDYRPQSHYTHKVKSGIKRWDLSLVPTPKIIDFIKKLDWSIFLVGFKFEPKSGKRTLIEKTRELLSRANLDLAVANTSTKNKYLAYIVTKNRTYGAFKNKNALVEQLIATIGEDYGAAKISAKVSKDH